MKRWALIEAGRVANVVEQENCPQIPGEWVEAGLSGPGWGYSEGVFLSPSPAPARRLISKGALFDRFGAVKPAILASSDPSVQAVIKDASVRDYIDLDNPELSFGLDVILQAGFAIDKQAILGGVILPIELPEAKAAV